MADNEQKDDGLDIFQEFGTNEKLELEGVWVEFGGGLQLLIARMNNPNYAKLRDEKVKPYRNLPNGIPKEAAEKILVDCMAGAILLGWRGKPLRFKGEVLEYSVPNALKVLGVKDFRESVLLVSNEASVYRDAVITQARKNSPTSSAGATGTGADENSTMNG